MLASFSDGAVAWASAVNFYEFWMGGGRSAAEQILESLTMHIPWGMPKLRNSVILPREPL